MKIDKYLVKLFGEDITKANDRSFRDIDKEVRRILRESHREVISRIEELFLKHSENGALSRKDVYAYNRLIKLEDEIAKNLHEAGVEVNRQSRSLLNKTFQQTFLKGIEGTEKLGIKFGEYKVPTEVLQANLYNPMDRIKWSTRSQAHVQNYVDRIRNEISRSIVQGDSYYDTALRINRLGEKLYYDIVRIVRTEQHRVQSAAVNYSFEVSQKAAERQGLRLAKQWVAAQDNRTRDEHDELDGQLADEEGYFEVDGMRAQYPGGFGIPEMDINCRCSIATVLI